jgi:hypothetical protein
MGFSLKVNTPGHEAGNLPPSIAKVKNGGVISPLPQYICN